MIWPRTYQDRRGAVVAQPLSVVKQLQAAQIAKYVPEISRAGVAHQWPGMAVR